LRLLAHRDHTQHTLSQKLKSKGYALSEIEPLIKELSLANLINDQRYAEQFIHFRREKGYGPLRITLDLQNKGLDAAMIAQHLQINDNAWLNAVRKVWHKRFKGQSPVTIKEQAKQLRFLQYRGFTQEQINSLLKPLS
jgi:regulatory protein